MKKSTPLTLHKYPYETGAILMLMLVMIFVFTTAMLGLLALASQQIRLVRSTANRELAFQIAEAGVNYYQWHLAHFPTDYQDGTGLAGPYVHDFKDAVTQDVLGQYSLEITPPGVGSSAVTIKSTGWTLANPQTKREVTTQYGIPSLAKYAFLTQSDVWVGSGETVSGQFHANGGIHFDGTGNAPITSAKQTYTCTATFGCSPSVTKNGIWGSAGASTQQFWQYPVPNVDFSALTADLADIKTNAQLDGIYLPPSSAQGYSLVFNSNATVSVYKVTSLQTHTTGFDVAGVAHNEDLDYQNRTLQFTQSLPSNGLIFAEDRTWVEGTVAGRVTVATGKFPYNPASSPSILIPNNIVYLAKDGTNALGLISQKDIVVTYYVPNILEINAAMIAQNGSIQRYYFGVGTTKTSVSVYGSMASFGVWSWSWLNGSGTVTSGFVTTSTVYDGDLLYGPPPSFPVTPDGYQQIYWSSK